MKRPGMKRLGLATLAVALGLSALGLSLAVAQPPRGKLDLLQGTWSGTIAGVSTAALPAHVTYTAATGGVVLGTTKVLNGQGRAVYFEFERFQLGPKTARLFPYPSGKAATGFTLAESSATRLVFTNPTKDWPRRLVYERTAADRLVITASKPGSRTLRLDLRRR